MSLCKVLSIASIFDNYVAKSYIILLFYCILTFTT